MRFKKTLLALVACLALTAVAGASAAQAAVHWNVNGSTLAGSETVSVSGGPWTLNGTTLGTTVELTAEAIKCGSTCTISGAGESAGTLQYTGVKVVKPANCTAGNPGKTAGTITTNSLKDQIIMDPNNAAGPVFDKFSPASGTKFVEIEFHGALCALDELALPVEGTAGGQSPNATGVEKVEQSLSFGSSQQSTSNSALTLGGGSVTLGGTAINKLSGANLGKAFGATE